MPPGEGFFINTKTGEEVEVYEHFDAVLKDPEHFGIYLKDTPTRDPETRQRILTNVIRNGWIRVRMHRNQNTFETWRINDDALFSILEFTDRHKLWDNEVLDIHEVGQAGGGMRLKVGALKKKLAPTMESILAQRCGCPVFQVRISAVEGALPILAEHLVRLNEYGMSYITERANGEWVLEVHSWLAESGYCASSVGLLALVRAIQKVVESEARTAGLDVLVLSESD